MCALISLFAWKKSRDVWGINWSETDYFVKEANDVLCKVGEIPLAASHQKIQEKSPESQEIRQKINKNTDSDLDKVPSSNRLKSSHKGPLWLLWYYTANVKNFLHCVYQKSEICTHITRYCTSHKHRKIYCTQITRLLDTHNKILSPTNHEIYCTQNFIPHK